MYNSKIEPGSLFPTINSLSQSFTKSEKKVLDAFLKNPEDLLYSSIIDYAEKAGVGDTTVIRFCRKLGFKGYHSFKMAVAQELSRSSEEILTNFNEEIGPHEDIETIMQKLIKINISALQETAALIKEEQVNMAVKFIESSQRVIFFGSGSSGITALDAKNKFMRVGLYVDAFADGHMQAMAASLLNKEDTAVAISHSGSSKDTVEALKIAKQCNAKTICITHHAASPITKYADVMLLSGYREGPLQGGAMATKIAQLYVIDILYTEFFRKNLKASSANKAKTTEAITEKLY